MNRYLIIFLLCFSSVKTYSQSFDCCISSLAKCYNLSDSLLKNWRNDPNGCLQKRALIVDSLIKENSILIGMPQPIFESLFGKPEEKTEEGIFVYFISAKCDEKSKPISKSWGMELYVRFVENKVYSLDKINVN